MKIYSFPLISVVVWWVWCGGVLRFRKTVWDVEGPAYRFVP